VVSPRIVAPFDHPGTVVSIERYSELPGFSVIFSSTSYYGLFPFTYFLNLADRPCGPETCFSYPEQHIDSVEVYCARSAFTAAPLNTKEEVGRIQSHRH
jgi:hypothetical protein